MISNRIVCCEVWGMLSAKCVCIIITQLFDHYFYRFLSFNVVLLVNMSFCILLYICTMKK